MHHISFGLEIVQFCSSVSVYHEYVINVSCVKESIVLNFRVEVRVFKLVHVVVCVW